MARVSEEDITRELGMMRESKGFKPLYFVPFVECLVADLNSTRAENDKLKRDDEVHWKTRRTLLQENQALREELAKKDGYLEALAPCMLDLDSNLQSANDEWMAGKIPEGAFDHVLSRHISAENIFHAAGLTEQHKLFGFPVKLEPERKAPRDE